MLKLSTLKLKLLIERRRDNFFLFSFWFCFLICFVLLFCGLCGYFISVSYMLLVVCTNYTCVGRWMLCIVQTKSCCWGRSQNFPHAFRSDSHKIYCGTHTFWSHFLIQLVRFVVCVCWCVVWSGVWACYCEFVQLDYMKKLSVGPKNKFAFKTGF